MDHGSAISAKALLHIVHETHFIRLIDVRARVAHKVDVLIHDVIRPHVHTLQPGLIVVTLYVVLALGIQTGECTTCESFTNGEETLAGFRRKDTRGKDVTRRRA